VFENLIESKRKSDKKKAFGLGFVSLVGHGVLVVLAVIATLTAGQAATDEIPDTMMVFLNQEEKKPEEQPPVLEIPQLKGFQTVVAPTDIPTNIPPINLQEHFDPKDYSGTGVEGGIGTGIVPSSDQVYMESVVEERPEVLSGPQLQYPTCCGRRRFRGGCWCRRLSTRRAGRSRSRSRCSRARTPGSISPPGTTCCAPCSVPRGCTGARCACSSISRSISRSSDNSRGAKVR